jgi:formate transporter
MYFVPFALLLAWLDPTFVATRVPAGPALGAGAFVVRNLVPVTLGNIIGGALVVGGTYWFVYLRPRARGATG